MGSQERKRSNIYGWDSESDVANEIYCSSFRSLLEGNLVFAYKNPKSTGTLKLLVITKTSNSYMVGLIPQGNGWTYYNPSACSGYLKDVILKDLQNNKTETYIIEDFIYCVNYYDKT